MVRTPSFDKNGMKKGAWSPEEDNKLRAYIQRYGHWNWRELPKYAGLSRCGKSCRLRWMNYLRPNVKRGSYTKEEEDLIIKLHEKLGNKWSLIAAKLPGRTDNEIKNHWHTHLKKRPKQNQATQELKEQAIETSQSEANLEVQSLESPQFEVNQKTELASKDVADQPLPQLILESTPLSPEPSSSEFSSLSTSDYPLLSDMSWVAEDSISSWESFAEPIGNFWTEPFLEDVSYNNQNDFSTKNLVEGGFMSPYSSYYDDGIDFFYQMLQDFSKN